MTNQYNKRVQFVAHERQYTPSENDFQHELYIDEKTACEDLMINTCPWLSQAEWVDGGFICFEDDRDHAKWTSTLDRSDMRHYEETGAYPFRM